MSFLCHLLLHNKLSQNIIAWDNKHLLCQHLWVRNKICILERCSFRNRLGGGDCCCWKIPVVFYASKMAASSGVRVKRMERSGGIPGIFRKLNKQDLLNEGKNSKWGRRRGQRCFLGLWHGWLDTMWYHFPREGDCLCKGEPGQGDDDGVGFGHAEFEGPVWYPVEMARGCLFVGFQGRMVNGLDQDWRVTNIW